jgi:hypothetical protein
LNWIIVPVKLGEVLNYDGQQNIPKIGVTIAGNLSDSSGQGEENTKTKQVEIGETS